MNKGSLTFMYWSIHPISFEKLFFSKLLFIWQTTNWTLGICWRISHKWDGNSICPLEKKKWCWPISYISAITKAFKDGKVEEINQGNKGIYLFSQYYYILFQKSKTVTRLTKRMLKIATHIAGVVTIVDKTPMKWIL